MNKTLIFVGAFLIIAGVLWPWLIKSGLGRLPGDIIVQKKNVTFYFPLATSLLISALLTLVLLFFSKRP